jgi:hypothetical protein
MYFESQFSRLGSRLHVIGLSAAPVICFVSAMIQTIQPKESQLCYMRNKCRKVEPQNSPR